MPDIMDQKERDFWIAVTLWGAALVTLFGTGTFAFIQDEFWWGIGYCGFSLAGLVAMTLYLRGHRVAPSPAFAGVMITITWAFFGYIVWSRHDTAPNGSSGANNAPTNAQQRIAAPPPQKSQPQPTPTGKIAWSGRPMFLNWSHQPNGSPIAARDAASIGM